ncbi:MAG: hypothetical protein ACOC97_03315 [Myxococcota bacterium]
MSESTGPSGVRYHVRATSARVTPPPARQRFRQALDAGAGALMSGVESAASYVPGGTALTAAVRGARHAGSQRTGNAASPAPLGGGPASPGEALLTQADQSMQYLHLQEQISAENRRFSTLSNVMKARHDTAKAAINNIK